MLSFGVRLRDFTAEHPGLASYLQVLFPRGEAGTRLLSEEVEALSRRGYSTDAAMVLSSAVAALAISLAAREESNANAIGGDQAYVGSRRSTTPPLTGWPVTRSSVRPTPRCRTCQAQSSCGCC